LRDNNRGPWCRTGEDALLASVVAVTSAPVVDVVTSMSPVLASPVLVSTSVVTNSGDCGQAPRARSKRQIMAL
jgi:hypothetical protein